LTETGHLPSLVGVTRGFSLVRGSSSGSRRFERGVGLGPVSLRADATAQA